MSDPRYSSGTSLVRTGKEEQIDYLEGMLGDLGDNLFLSLKKLTVAQLRQLHALIAQRINEAYENK